MVLFVKFRRGTGIKEYTIQFYKQSLNLIIYFKRLSLEKIPSYKLQFELKSGLYLINYREQLMILKICSDSSFRLFV